MAARILSQAAQKVNSYLRKYSSSHTCAPAKARWEPGALAAQHCRQCSYCYVIPQAESADMTSTACSWVSFKLTARSGDCHSSALASYADADVHMT